MIERGQREKEKKRERNREKEKKGLKKKTFKARREDGISVSL